MRFITTLKLLVLSLPLIMFYPQMFAHTQEFATETENAQPNLLKGPEREDYDDPLTEEDCKEDIEYFKKWCSEGDSDGIEYDLSWPHRPECLWIAAGIDVLLNLRTNNLFNGGYCIDCHYDPIGGFLVSEVYECPDEPLEAEIPCTYDSDCPMYFECKGGENDLDDLLNQDLADNNSSTEVSEGICIESGVLF